MNLNTSTKSALSLSILISLFVLIFSNFFFNADLFRILIFVGSTLVFSFIIIKIIFQNYIERHLNKVFKIIYGSKNTYQEKESLPQLISDTERWKKDQESDLNSLQKQNNYRKEFIGNLSHELKTPLFSIQGYVETLLDGGIDDPNINKAYLKKAAKNVERLSAIINDVDTIAKVESDALNLTITNFNVLELIEDVVENLELIADKNDIELFINLESSSLKVKADKEKIRRVLINLITNSIKYGKEDGKTTLSVSNLMNKAIVEVSDNGLGIKEEQLPRIFERFYRVDSNRSREQGGSGLGLAIVKHIIEAHKQKITVKSNYGKGTNFSFSLEKA